MNNKNGFTLVELFLVIAIIAILAAIAIPQFHIYRTKTEIIT
ncbi:MAG: prepilin-type N-terminal cleavage/methylation domain-containing protein, partial [Proteobacteria bacterium]|nr:prepilin-type N-terminal cleavage/methylation domain-containing protein [Pseudomonadota bacterium]